MGPGLFFCTMDSYPPPARGGGSFMVMILYYLGMAGRNLTKRSLPLDGGG
jgi:hypothetical protein